MALRNSIIFDKSGKVKFDTNGAITLSNVEVIKSIKMYACPLRLQDVSSYTFVNKVLSVDKPGRYLIEYD